MNKFLQLYYKNKDLANNFLWRILQIGSKQGLSFLILLISVKILNPYDFGIYNYIISAVFLLAAFSDFGISTSTAKYVSEYSAKYREGVNKVLANSLVLVSISAVVITGLVLLFGRIIIHENYKFILYVLPLVFLLPLSSLYDGYYRGLKKFKKLAILSLIVGSISLLLAFWLISLFSLKGALLAQITYYLLFSLCALIFSKPVFKKVDSNLLRKLFSYSSLVGLANVGGFLYTRADMLMMGYWGFTVETGYYGLVNSAYMLSLFAFSILGAVIAPDNIRIGLVEKRWDIIKKKVIKYMIMSFLIGTLITIVAYILGPLVIKIFLPNYFNDGFLQIFRLFISIIPIAIVESTLTNGFVTPLGYVGILTRVVIIGGVINIILNLLLFGIFGYIGIVVGTVVISNVANIIKIGLFWSKLNKESCI